MNASSTKRWLIWGSLLLAAGWLACFGDRSTQQGAQAVVRPVDARRVQPARTEVRTDTHVAKVTWLAPTPRTELIRPTPAAPVDLFAARSWAPPPPPPVAVQIPVAAPTAPPLPFAYAGKKLQDGQWEVYLMKGDITLIARQGAVVEDQYVVEQIEPPTMRLKYRPLGQTQSLTIGE